MRRPVTASILSIGATSAIAQIVALRELITVFYGNEIAIGFMLAVWLLSGAAGSLLLGRIADKIKGSATLFAACQFLLGLYLPIIVILIRNIRHIFSLLPGEIAPLGITIMASFIAFGPLCITLGFLFALCCRIFPHEDPALKIGRVYILESIGAAVGGLLASFFLIKYFTSLNILTALAAVNIASALYLLLKSRLLSLAWMVALFLLIGTGVLAKLEHSSREVEWRPFKVIESRDSIYGNITVARADSQVSFFSNGLYNFTIPDKLSQEETAHFLLTQHPRPRSVLLIGGGTGILWEILKHPVSRIDYVELDLLAITLAQKHLAGTQYYALDDPKVKIINTDGRFYVKNTRSLYDVVIISLAGPYTAQLNRFYTDEFFREAKKIMGEAAILGFGVTASENYISPQLGNFLASLYNTLKNVFPEAICLPGDTAYFLASNKRNALSTDYKKISETLKARNISADFINEAYLFARFSKERIDYINQALSKYKTVSPNRDFRPISYYFDMILWSTYFGFEGLLGKAAQGLRPKYIWLSFLILYVIIIISGRIRRRGDRGRLGGVLTAIGTTGFSEIVFEIVVMLSFQIIYGFLYYRLGLILTSFMIGLSLGSIYMTKKMSAIKDHYGSFIKVQAAIVLYPFILPLIFMSPSRFLNIIFPFLPAVAGFIGGLQFPLGNKIYLSAKGRVGEAGGLTYGVDLLGACVGATLVSAFVIPIIGVFQTCAAVGLLNLSVLLSLL